MFSNNFSNAACIIENQLYAKELSVAYMEEWWISHVSSIRHNKESNKFRSLKNKQKTSFEMNRNESYCSDCYDNITNRLLTYTWILFVSLLCGLSFSFIMWCYNLWALSFLPFSIRQILIPFSKKKLMMICRHETHLKRI